MKNIWKLFFILFFFSSLTFVVLADIKDSFNGVLYPARPLALGNAYVGLSDDTAGMFFNPAGLPQTKRFGLVTMFSRPFSNTNLTLLGWSFPNILGTIGLGYRNQNNAYVINTVNYSAIDQDITILYAKDFFNTLFLGVNARLINKSISPTLVGASGSGRAGEIGLKYNYRPWLSFGAVAKNLFGKITYDDNVVDNLYGENVIGLSWKLGGKDGFYKNLKNELVINLDHNKRADLPIGQYHLGVEWEPTANVALRAGIDQMEGSATANKNNYTAGLGFKYGEMIFDYTYKQWDDGLKTKSHYFSVSFMGPETKKPTPEAAPKLEIIHFTDVLPGYWAQKPIENLATLGLVTYYPDETFKPERTISRAESVMLFVRAKEYLLPKDRKKIFVDVAPNAWGADYIQAAYENKLTNGFPDGTFQPRKAVTRAEAGVFLARFDSLSLPEGTEEEEQPYSDVGLRHWSLKDVLAAKEGGILDYLKNHLFLPDKELTRAELAEMLSKTKIVKRKVQAAGIE